LPGHHHHSAWHSAALTLKAHQEADEELALQVQVALQHLRGDLRVQGGGGAEATQLRWPD
jgi:hypothetical protein